MDQAGPKRLYRISKVPGVIYGLGWHCREQKGSIAQVSQQNGFRRLHPAAGGERHRGVFKGNGVALFQQDGATCHTSRKTKQWFVDKGVVLLNGWPSNSPDLSPIEQVWGISKRFIIQRHGMRTPLTLADLERATFEAFNNIAPRTIAILTKSVEFRVRLCVERNGRFVGDAIEECCRRAKIEVDSVNEIQTVPFTLTADGRSNVRRGDEQGEEQDRPLASLPSFRTVQ